MAGGGQIGRRMAVRVVLAPACISSPAAAQEASAWMGELARTGALQPADNVYVSDPAGGWIKGDVGGLSTGDLEARAGAASAPAVGTETAGLERQVDAAPSDTAAGGSLRSAR